MSTFDSLLVSAQELLISIVEDRLNRLSRCIQDSDSDVEMVDLEFFDDPVPIDLCTKGIYRSEPFGTCAGVIQSHHLRR